MSIDVVGIGTPVLDMALNLSHIPTQDSFLRANEMLHQGGGKVATAMAACARLGLKAGVMAKIGGDQIGDLIINDFLYNNVDTSRILRGGLDTTSPYIITLSDEKDGLKIFIGRNYGNVVRHLEADEVDFDYISSAKYLLLENGGEASLASAKFAKERDIPVIVDADSFSEAMENMLPWVDVFIGSESYQSNRFGQLGMKESCQTILSQGPKVAWFTLGAQGCAGIADNVYHEIPAFDINVKDTTGAGDVFHGAYIAAMSENMPHLECARFASAVSAIKCTYAGGRTGIPTKEVAFRFLKDNVIDTSELDQRLEHYRSTFTKRDNEDNKV
ncbi:MAG: carbohydrate kinase family protein [Oscillospiraceae bacterium]|jgi:sugar/nucleoside kinase (ribokinase family)|nr:carbohydrate kinase family protein [Oscillospiraceae bacterium]